jgi:electron-transferring-flavoprotein dehydrogenase
MLVFRTPLSGIERPQMEADVVIVGGGPAGMACALRLSQLIDEHNAAHHDAQISKENIYLLEKAREVGQHCLSGALLDPRSMRELLPGFEKEAPIEAEVSKESVHYLTKGGGFKLPVTPPPLRDHGNYVISINRFVKWLGQKIEEAGITIFTGFAGSELLVEGERVIGVRTDDKGVDKNNQQKSNFEPGYDLKAKVVVLAEGPRGSLTKQLVGRFQLDKDRNPQTYGVGAKELWEVPSGRIAPGEVIYSMGWPLTSSEYGGSWIYGGKDNVVSLGFVTGLDYPDPRLDPQRVLQEFKTHPMVRKLLEGGKMIRYGAKSLPYGGWWAVPPVAGNGWMIVGDSAGFLNSQRLKGIHLAIKSGMLAAETVFDSMVRDDYSSAQLGTYQRRIENSWIKQELWPVRNFHQGFEHGFWHGLFHAGIQQITGGRGLHARYAATAGHRRLKKLAELSANGNGRAHLLNDYKGDGKLTFDKLTDVYHSGTKHEEDQPAHLVIHDTSTAIRARISARQAFTKWSSPRTFPAESRST